MAVASTLLLALFRLTMHGLVLSIQLNVVIVLHELGHMAAYRAFGHRSARMIVIPLLAALPSADGPMTAVSRWRPAH